MNAIWIPWERMGGTYTTWVTLFVWCGSLKGDYAWKNLAPNIALCASIYMIFWVTLVMGIDAQNDSWSCVTVEPTFEIISRVRFGAWVMVLKALEWLLRGTNWALIFSMAPNSVIRGMAGLKVDYFLNSLSFGGKSFTFCGFFLYRGCKERETLMVRLAGSVPKWKGMCNSQIWFTVQDQCRPFCPNWQKQIDKN